MWTTHLHIPCAGTRLWCAKAGMWPRGGFWPAHPDLLVVMHAPAAGTVEDILPQAVLLALDPPVPKSTPMAPTAWTWSR